MLGANSSDHKHQSHGKTVAETRELKEHIASGGEYPMINANVKKNFKIKESEKHLIHVTIEQKRFDPETGKRLSKPAMQCFYIDDFLKMSAVTKSDSTSLKPAENAFAGSEVIIVHDPRLNDKKKVETKDEEVVFKLEDLSDEELRERYLEVIGEESDPADDKIMLIALINEKLAAK